jgi:hypothetical protein
MQRAGPHLTAFAVHPQVQHPAPGVDVPNLERAQLLPPQSVVEQHREDGAIPLTLLCLGPRTFNNARAWPSPKAAFCDGICKQFKELPSRWAFLVTSRSPSALSTCCTAAHVVQYLYDSMKRNAPENLLTQEERAYV